MVMPMCSKDDKKNMFPPSEWNFNKTSDKCYERFKVRPNQNMATMIYGGKVLEYVYHLFYLFISSSITKSYYFHAIL